MTNKEENKIVMYALVWFGSIGASIYFLFSNLIVSFVFAIVALLLYLFTYD